MLTGLYLRLALVAGLLATLASGYAYITHLQDRAEVAERNVSVAESAARTNAATADAIRQDAARQIAAISAEASAASARAGRFAAIRKDIAHAPTAAQVCPLGPATRTAIDGLWPRGKADPGNQVGTANSAGRVAVLPPGPRAATF